MKNIEEQVKEKYNKIVFHHQKKDIEALKSTISQMTEEHDKAKSDLNTLSYYLDLLDKYTLDEPEDVTGPKSQPAQTPGLSKKIRSELEKIHLKDTGELTVQEREFIKTEKTKLISEHNHLEKQLNYFDALIAHAKVLLLDLQEQYCSDLTNGEDLAQTAQKLRDKFGTELKGTSYYAGRDQIIRFLEHTYSINRIKSKQIFNLLEDTGILKFKIDTSYINVTYYDFDVNEDNITWGEPMIGTWFIHA